MSCQLSEIEDIKQYIFNLCFMNNGTVIPSLTRTINDLPFQPDFAIIRSVIPNNDSTTAISTVFIIRSDLNSRTGDLVSFSGYGFPSFPQTTICIRRPITNITFDLFQLNKDNTVGPVVPVAGKTFYLSVTIDFIKLKKFDSHKVLYK